MKNLKFLLPSIIILLVVVVFTSQVRSNEKSSNTYKALNGLPDSIKIIVEKSCYGCHSNSSTNNFAKSALNFEKWDTYSLKDQGKSKGKIYKKVMGDKMPPSGYLDKNPNAKLTEKEKMTICNWSKPVKK